MPVYRKVTLIIQNNTDDILVASGSAMLRGEWSPPAPTNDFVIEQQSTHILHAQSETVGVGVEGYVRFSTTQGYIRLEWSRPWVGNLTYRCAVEGQDGTVEGQEVTVEGQDGNKTLHISFEVEADEPAFPVLVCQIQSRSKPELQRVLRGVVSQPEP